ncbi:MAG: AAA family ATPase [Syntrophorhabdus aromaticivorans]|uniref:AAA family ATPase n=1 Tax=Syntrophorhabdus aromaticivorans TaxID=328301 RepID=A0A971S0D6_9BACT|nr:AAA family ATPase [Syntrophorhabdus aromaticivorans]
MDETPKDLIDFLLNPGSYPEGTTGVSHIETHISHVFLCDDFVYKIKKPVNFGFLDFSTLRKRHFYCRQEVSLNARLAKDIYLGVQPLFKRKGAYTFVTGAKDRVAEYAVKMRRIPLNCLLSKLIGEGKPLYRDLEEVGRVLALFHRDAPPYKGSRLGGLETIVGATEENFEQIQPFCGVTLQDSVYARLADYTRGFIADHKGRFSWRRKAGYVRDGHGDLHCQHICLEHPPIIFDCIEFNEGFRIIDVLQDIAFLFMDLEYQGRFDLSSRLFKAYFGQESGLFDGPLLQFYRVYRSVVRGKVEGFAAQAIDDQAAKDKAMDRARNYFGLADYYVRHFQKPFNPVVFMGLSGSGKSTIARDFSPNSIILRSDEIRKEITGIRPGTHAYSAFRKGIYTQELTRQVYCTLLEKAINHAKKGRKVIVDATYLKASQRKDFFQTCMENGLNPFFIHCFAAEDVLKTRIRERIREGTDVSDADLAVLENQLQHLEEPEELPCYRVLRINTEDVLHRIIYALREFL